MEQEQIMYFLALYGRFYAQDKIPKLIKELKAMSEESFEKLKQMPKKDPLLMLTYSFCFGYFGVDRMMLGQMRKGLLKLAIVICMCLFVYAIDSMEITDTAQWILSLLALGICSIWVIFDWCKIEKMTKEYNYKEIEKLF